MYFPFTPSQMLIIESMVCVLKQSTQPTLAAANFSYSFSKRPKPAVAIAYSKITSYYLSHETPVPRSIEVSKEVKTRSESPRLY